MSENFCILPFISGYVSTQKDFKLCCEFQQTLPGHNFEEIWNGPDYKEYRHLFLDGVMPAACENCTSDEKAGIESHRQSQLKRFPIDVEHYTTTKQVVVPPPKSFDIRFSNYCNLECVMCDPQNSSAIATRVLNYSLKESISNVYNSRENTNTHKTTLEFLYKNIHELRELVLAGGEPFLMPEVKSLLEYCVEQGVAKNISLRITTNATIVRTKWWNDFLLKFKHIDLLCSVDATDEILEYVRFPSKWTVIRKNLLLFKQLAEDNSNFVFRIEMCLHALNFKNFPTLINFAVEHNIPIMTSLVYYIAGQSEVINYDVLDVEYRKSIIDQINFDKLKTVQTNINQKLLSTLIETSKRQLTQIEKRDISALIVYWDSHKKVKFNELYPELEFLIK